MSPEPAGRLGLDELMIVNPDADGLRAVLLGGDGGLYGVADAGPARFFLGADGAVYELAGDDAAGLAQGEDERAASARFFLGDDGTLYEVTAGPRTA